MNEIYEMKRLALLVLFLVSVSACGDSISLDELNRQTMAEFDKINYCTQVSECAYKAVGGCGGYYYNVKEEEKAQEIADYYKQHEGDDGPIVYCSALAVCGNVECVQSKCEFIAAQSFAPGDNCVNP